MDASSCDLPEFYDETYPVARKEHRCCECGGVIKSGERYARCAGKWDGDLSCYRQHVACRDFAARINREFGAMGECFIPFGGVSDAIHNASEFAGPNDAAALQATWAEIRTAGRGEIGGEG